MSHTRTLDTPARALLALLFLVNGGFKLASWGATAGQMAQKGIPLVPFMLAASAAIELGGGLSLMMGWHPRRAALLLCLYLIPVTLTFHAFWREAGAAAQTQLMSFLKNLSIMGGLLAVAAPTVLAELEDPRGKAPPAGEGSIGPASEGPRASSPSAA